MRKKKALLLSLVTLLFFSMTIVQVDAQEALVWVNPDEVTVPKPSIGLNFTVEVGVSNVALLYGYDFMLTWNTALLDLIDINVTIPAVWGSDYFIVKNDTSVPGRYWHALIALTPAVPFSGNITVTTLTFEVTGIGSCDLDLVDTKLADSKGDPILHSTEDGYFTCASAAPTPPAERAPFPVVNVIIVILFAIFFVAALYYLRKRISSRARARARKR